MEKQRSLGSTWARVSFQTRVAGGVIGVAVLALGCGESEKTEDPNAIVIGAALPFTGPESTIGQNIEQAMLLAVEDVNRAGGINGRSLRLEARDSNSGSSRGLEALLDLLYNEQVRYLVGPEENELADEIVPDIKGLDVLNVLPGYASPSIERTVSRGAWLRLPPSPLAFGCGLAELARQTGVHVANSIQAQDDFNQGVASEFSAEFFGIGGDVLASTTIRDGAVSYQSRISDALTAGADKTLLIVNPTAAVRVVTEWALERLPGAWLFGPMLHTPGFLENVPSGALNGTYLLSPTLSLTSECEQTVADYRGSIACERSNAEAFSDYFASRWDGETPFPAAHFYYDAVILLAMGLQYSAAQGHPEPTTDELHTQVLSMTKQASRLGRWDELEDVMGVLGQGEPLRYAGAAAEYDFDQFGAAKHLVFDAWRIEHQAYVSEGTLQARCLRQPK